MEIIPNWHPVFVHFTVALLTLSVLLYVAGSFIKRREIKEQCLITARWNLWAGTSFTLITVLTGWYAYNSVVHDEPSHLAMTDHRNWALATAALFIVLMLISVWRFIKARPSGIFMLPGLLVGMILLVSTAWRGGELVFRYGLGVMSLPQQEADVGDGHSHHHDELPATKEPVLPGHHDATEHMH